MKTKFTIECEMEERWANDFCGFLRMLQANGAWGHSSLIGFYADGDGDFRPKFNFKDAPEFKEEECHITSGKDFGYAEQCQWVFDAG